MEDELPPSPPPADTAHGTALEPPVAPAVAQPPPGFKDRGTGLVLFGILQIILGLLAALMIPLAMLGVFMSRFAPGATMHPAQIVSGIVSYGVIAAAFVTLGIGSIRMLRWARALTLVSSWYWLVVGVLVTILLTAVMPMAMRTALAKAQQNTPNAPPPELTTGIMAVMVTFFIVFAALFLVAIPIAFIVFYSRNDVALTCRHRDPVERWTDRAPLPILGASVVLFVGALYMFVTGISTPLFPFFGRYLTGIAGGACFFVLGAIDLYLAVGIFRLQSSAWWIAVLLSPVRLLSMALSYARADLMQAYGKLGFSDTELQTLNSTPMFRSHVILWWSLISLILFFAYLIWLKRFFKPPAAALPETLAPAGSINGVKP